jgi:hypothetical protein
MLAHSTPTANFREKKMIAIRQQLANSVRVALSRERPDRPVPGGGPALRGRPKRRGRVRSRTSTPAMRCGGCGGSRSCRAPGKRAPGIRERVPATTPALPTERTPAPPTKG